MLFELSNTEIRILGCLIEKSMATPEYYPLTLNALVAACNQKSNRDPVMDLSEADIQLSLDELRYTHKLVSQVSIAGSRVQRYRYNIDQHVKLEDRELAICCELMLRGPQTAAELRTRAQRMTEMPSTSDVENLLDDMAIREVPLLVKMPREPGRRECRYRHLFGGEAPAEVVQEYAATSEPPPASGGLAARLTALETAVIEQRAMIARIESVLRENGFDWPENAASETQAEQEIS